MRTRIAMSTFCATLVLMLITLTSVSRAQSAATERVLRNIEIALTIDIPGDLKAGEIPRGKEFAARTLASDLDGRVKRARGYFQSIEAADRANAAVVAIGQRIDDMERIGVKLGASVAAQTANAADSKTRHFAFMAELKGHEPAVMRFNEITKDNNRDIISSVGPQEFKKWVDELGVVNEACTTRYKGIQNDPTYARTPATSPADWCKLAAQRDTYAYRAAVNHVTAMSARRMKDLQDLAKTPENNNGYLMNWVVTAVSEPAGVKTTLVAEARPWYAIVGKELPDGFFAPVDNLMRDVSAAIDRTATTWTYPDDKFHDPRVEGIVQKQMAAGVKVVRTSLAAGDWTIDKNAKGVEIDRYRTGHILVQMPTLKWCSLREFTYLEKKPEGGAFQPAASATLSEAVRFQACK